MVHTYEPFPHTAVAAPPQKNPPNVPPQPLILLNTILSPNKMQQQSSEPKKRKKNGFSFCSMLGVEMKFYVFCIEENELRKNEKLTQQREKKKKFVDAKIQLLRKSYKLQRQQERGGEKTQKFVDNLVSKLSELGGFFYLENSITRNQDFKDPRDIYRSRDWKVGSKERTLIITDSKVLSLLGRETKN
jgi:hypothetical protein